MKVFGWRPGEDGREFGDGEVGLISVIGAQMNELSLS